MWGSTDMKSADYRGDSPNSEIQTSNTITFLDQNRFTHDLDLHAATTFERSIFILSVAHRKLTNTFYSKQNKLLISFQA